MAFITPATINEYKELLLRLSPPGVAFGPDGRYEDFLYACAIDIARHHNRCVDAELESDPRTADETIEAWEYMLGITSPMVTLEDRQAEVYARYIATGGQSVAYFTEIAAALGVTITITEPLALGWSPADPPCAPLYSWTARYIWIVDGPAATFPSTRAALVALFEELKPEHTRVLFTWNA